jgi:hypothetical protein
LDIELLVFKQTVLLPTLVKGKTLLVAALGFLVLGVVAKVQWRVLAYLL